MFSITLRLSLKIKRLSSNAPSGYHSGGGTIAMTEWAKEQASELRKRQEAENEKTKKFNEEQRLKREQGHKLWAEVKQWVMDNSDSLNAEMKSTLLLFENTAMDNIRVQHLGTHNLLEALHAVIQCAQFSKQIEVGDHEGRVCK